MANGFGETLCHLANWPTVQYLWNKYNNNSGLSLLKANLIKPRKHLNPELSNKTTQMKALDEYFLMVVFTLLLNTAHVFAFFYVLFEQRNIGSERVIVPGVIKLQ